MKNFLLLPTSCLTSVCWQLLSTIMNWLQHHRPNESENRVLQSSLLKAGPISKLDRVALPSARAFSIRGSTAPPQQYLAQFMLSSRVHSKVLFGNTVPAAHAGSRGHLTATGLKLVDKTGKRILKIKQQEHGCCAFHTTLLVLCQLPILSPKKRKQLIQRFLSKLKMTSHKATFITATENKMPKLCLSHCNKDSTNAGSGACFK